MDYNKCTVVQLKEELKKLGAKTSGTKQVLTERLQVWNRENLDRLLVEVRVVPPRSNDRFPDELCFKPLVTFDKKHFNFVNILFIHAWFEQRSAGAGFKKGRSLFLNKFVNSVMCCPTVKKDFYFTSVCAAQTKKKEEYIVKLHINSEELLQATCMCPAGTGMSAACKHVAALAYCIEHYSITGDIIENRPCTSSLQTWHKPKPGRCLEVVTIDEMLGLTATAENNTENRTDELCNLLINYQCPAPILQSRLVHAEAYIDDHDYCKDSLAVLTLNLVNKTSPCEAKCLEMKTRKQSDSNLWFELRQTRITASIAGSIVKTVRAGNFSLGYAKRQVQPQKLKTAAVMWGKTHEETAIKMYCQLLNDNVTRCGIFIDTERNYFGASPDGMVEGSDLVIEVKCPYSIRNNLPHDATYLTKTNDGYFKLKRNHNYYFQCQLQMHVTKVSRCDFIVWTLKGIFVEHLLYDKMFCDDAFQAIDQYYIQCFAPTCINYMWRNH